MRTNIPENLPQSARIIYAATLDALQDADEMGGPEGDDYIALMEAVAAEALRRANVCRLNLYR